MACDICDKRGTSLEPLRDIYATKDIRHICPECQKVVEDHLWKLKAMTGNILTDLLRRFMRERRLSIVAAPSEREGRE